MLLRGKIIGCEVTLNLIILARDNLSIDREHSLHKVSENFFNSECRYLCQGNQPTVHIYTYNSTAIIVLSIQMEANNPGGSGKDQKQCICCWMLPRRTSGF